MSSPPGTVEKGPGDVLGPGGDSCLSALQSCRVCDARPWASQFLPQTGVSGGDVSPGAQQELSPALSECPTGVTVRGGKLCLQSLWGPPGQGRSLCTKTWMLEGPWCRAGGDSLTPGDDLHKDNLGGSEVG